MPNTLDERDWNLLLRRIKDGKCTPFLGAGASCPTLSTGSKIAADWAQKYNYPLNDCNDLVRVAQFLAVQYDPMFPKEEILKEFEGKVPDFKCPNEPHGILAKLPLPIYITTNYDDFMMQALKVQQKDPTQELCRWNKSIKNQPPVFGSDYSPSPANPVVFHLHGHTGVPESLVLTEDDYLDFLVNISKDPLLLPSRIQEAFGGTSLLFLGYRLADWNFRVLFRSLVSYLESSLARAHVSVQLLPEGKTVSESEKEKVQEYFDHYFGNLRIHVYWGTCQEFIQDLKKRWEAFSSGN